MPTPSSPIPDPPSIPEPDISHITRDFSFGGSTSGTYAFIDSNTAKGAWVTTDPASDKPKKPATKKPLNKLPVVDKPFSSQNHRRLLHLRRLGYGGIDPDLEKSLFSDGFAWRVVTNEELAGANADHNGPRWVFIFKHNDLFRGTWMELFDNPERYLNDGSRKAVLKFAGLTLERWTMRPLPLRVRDMYKTNGTCSGRTFFEQLSITK